MPYSTSTENFAGRVDFAARVISSGRATTRNFDNCFENDDAECVIAALLKRASKNSRLAANFSRYLVPADMDRIGPLMALNARQLAEKAREMREESRAAFEAFMREQREREAQREQPKPRRVIQTASGAVSLGQYAKAWRMVKAAPAGTEFKSSLCGLASATREEILRQFTEGLHDRINLRGRIKAGGRKDSADYQTRLRRDQRAIRDRVTRRVRVYQLETAEARARFSHLLSSYGDD